MLLNDWLAKFNGLVSAGLSGPRPSRKRRQRSQLRLEQLEVRTLLTGGYIETVGDPAIRTTTGITTSTLAATDDGSSALTNLGFTIRIGETDFSSVYINNNGNVTFTTTLSAYTPFGISNASMALLAPFFADVDTRGTGLVQFGETEVDGFAAFGVNWDDVGYFNRKTNKLNDFQLLIIDRSDIAAGDFDFEFNYESVQWETGDFSGGSNGVGGSSARVGFADGIGSKMEFIGSGISGALLDGGSNSLAAYSFGSIVDGRYRFQVRDGVILSPISLTNTEVSEASAAGTVISSFASFDPNPDNEYTYSLVSGLGADDNAAFTIVGDELRTNTALDFETKSSYTIRVQAVNQHTVGFERILTLTVANVNDAPTDLSLSSASIAENLATGTAIGSLSSTDPDVGNTFTYSLVTGTGSDDNASFTIVGNELRSAAVFDFEAGSTRSVRVRTTDQNGLTFDKPLVITVTNVNEAPTDLSLSNASIAENLASGATVGTLSSTDPDVGNTFTYSLVTGTGSDDNASFTIVGNELRSAVAFNFEARSSYSVRVRTTDQNGLTFDEALAITVTNVNEAPTDISLTQSSVAENSPVGTAVGILSSTPSHGNEYALVDGTGSEGNASFTIVGNELRTAAVFDFESQSTYSLRVRTTDDDGLWFEKVLTIGVTDVNEAPVVTPNQRTLRVLSRSRRNRNNPGESVQQVFDNAPSNPVSDEDTGSQTGLAVIRGQTRHGRWEYSTDAGHTWHSLSETSAAHARLLDLATLLRFTPKRSRFLGTVSLTVVAWDQSSGTTGDQTDATVRGEGTPFSQETTTITHQVTRRRSRR